MSPQNLWIVLSVVILCGVFIPAALKPGALLSGAGKADAMFWAIEQELEGAGRCWISARKAMAVHRRQVDYLVTFFQSEAESFASETEAREEIRRLGLTDAWKAVLKNGGKP